MLISDTLHNYFLFFIFVIAINGKLYAVYSTTIFDTYASVILDCDLMRFPNSGLYHYCLNLGLEVNKLLEQENHFNMKMYLPEKHKEVWMKI